MIDARLLLSGLAARRTAPFFGDAASSLAATVTPIVEKQAAHQAALVQSIMPTEDAVSNSDFARGVLRGYSRIFTKHWSVFFSVPERGFTQVAPVPTPAEWDVFDQEAARRGVAGATINARNGAAEAAKNDNFVSKLGTNALAIEKQLDTYVPGWSVLLDGLTPLVPFMPLLTTILGAASNLGGQVGLLQTLLDTFSGAIKPLGTLANSGPDSVVQLPTAVQREVSLGFVSSAQSLVTAGASAIAPLQASIAKIAQTYSQAKGDVLAKLEAASAEALEQYVLGITITAALLTAGGAAVGEFALVAALAGAAARSLLTIDQALMNATALKDAAKAAKQAAQAKAKALDDEAAAILREIARLEGENAQAAQADQSALATVAKLAGLVLLGSALS